MIMWAHGLFGEFVVRSTRLHRDPQWVYAMDCMVQTLAVSQPAGGRWFLTRDQGESLACWGICGQLWSAKNVLDWSLDLQTWFLDFFKLEVVLIGSQKWLWSHWNQFWFLSQAISTWEVAGQSSLANYRERESVSSCSSWQVVTKEFNYQTGLDNKMLTFVKHHCDVIATS